MSANEAECLSRMGLNDHKAGMQGLDKARINKIILEASKGSKFYENELKKERQVTKRIERLKGQLDGVTASEIERATTRIDAIIAELESTRDLARKIVHVDMDAFYAAVEMKNNPSLKDKPMAVGGMSMLSTSNYAARRYGVRAAMPGFIAKRLCPELVLVKLNFPEYRRISQLVRGVLSQYDPNYDAMSLDEAYLDLTDYLDRRKKKLDTIENTVARQQENEFLDSSFKDDEDILGDDDVDEEAKEIECEVEEVSETSVLDSADSAPLPSSLPLPGFGDSVEDVVAEIRFRIKEVTGGLTASAGIAPNRMLAKVCSDRNKPDGQFHLESDREAVLQFVHNLPIRKVSGIGKVTERLLNSLGIVTCFDLYEKRATLFCLFSPTSFHFFLCVALGIGSTDVGREYDRKSMSVERTFQEINSSLELHKKCKELCEALAQDLQYQNLKGRTVTVKLKLVSFEVRQRASTLNRAVNGAEDIYTAASQALDAEIKARHPQTLSLRLMGIRMSNFERLDESQTTVRRLFEKAATTSSRSENETKFVCPVCGLEREFRSSNLTLVNAHVDSCLRQGKSASSSATGSPAKKRKVTNNCKQENDGSRTLLSYWDNK